MPSSEESFDLVDSKNLSPKHTQEEAASEVRAFWKCQSQIWKEQEWAVEVTDKVSDVRRPDCRVAGTVTAFSLLPTETG